MEQHKQPTTQPAADRRKPAWLKISRRNTTQYAKVHQLLADNCLHTICESGRCPNQCECWNRGTATFMILGEICTRGCRFCNTRTGKPLPPVPEEPQQLAASVKAMRLKHVVITSVTRDDLPDEGARHWHECIKAIRETNPTTTIEVLIPDFNGRHELLDIILEARPDIIGHNLETVCRLTPTVRSRAKYERSLDVLKYLHAHHAITKTGIMAGLGETQEEVLQLMDDVLQTGCQILTIGQYLQPDRMHIPVAEYITPEQFSYYKKIGIEKGFKHVESAPLVRSSYHAEMQIQ